MPEGVDENSPGKAPLTSEQQKRLDEIRELDSQTFSIAQELNGVINIYEQKDKEAALEDLATQLSEKTGIPKELVIDQIKKEGRVQREIATADSILYYNRVGNYSPREVADAKERRLQAHNELAKLREVRGKNYEEIVRAPKVPTSSGAST